VKTIPVKNINIRIIMSFLFVVCFASTAVKAKQIAIVIDDIGYHQRDLEPMQALNGKELGPGGLTLNMNKKQLQQTLGTALASLPQVKGVNNHMGSALTQQSQAMKWTMEVLKKRHLYFLDSRTTDLSQAQNAANFLGVANISRQVFLDNVTTTEQLQLRLNELKQQATDHNFAIAIAHPYPETIEFLRHALPKLTEQGFELVPVSQLVERKYIQLAQSEGKAGNAR